ncbi:hypothetical protein PFISCL1PPCAC_25815, partial [Pristionchus fissidentatus]
PAGRHASSDTISAARAVRKLLLAHANRDIPDAYRAAVISRADKSHARHAPTRCPRSRPTADSAAPIRVKNVIID